MSQRDIELEEAVLRKLERSLSPATANDLARAIPGKTKKDVNSTLYELERQGKVQKIDETFPPRWKKTVPPSSTSPPSPPTTSPPSSNVPPSSTSPPSPPTTSPPSSNDSTSPPSQPTTSPPSSNEDKPKFSDSPHCEIKDVPSNPIQKEQLELFAKKVVLLLHTCNDTEFWAVAEKLKPPTGDNKQTLADINHPVHFPAVWCAVGMFAYYRTAIVKTGQANECIAPLCKALTQSFFPNTQVIIGVGIAYAKDEELKYGDVIISKHIENCVQFKMQDGRIIKRGSRAPIRTPLNEVFCTPEVKSWEFYCTDSRKSSAQIGSIVSAPWLMRDVHLKEALFEDSTQAKGGEMEGWALLEVQKVFDPVSVIIIKGVADYGDNKKDDKWHITAAKAAVDFTHWRLQKTGGIAFKAQEIAEKVKNVKEEEMKERARTESKREEEKKKRFELVEDSLKKLDTIEKQVKVFKEFFEKQKHDFYQDASAKVTSTGMGSLPDNGGSHETQSSVALPESQPSSSDS